MVSIKMNQFIKFLELLIIVTLSLNLSFIFCYRRIALRCPNLKPPKNGYFVSKTCKNVYNAVCGVKCKPGYDLIGSSVTICQDDGMWSGSPAVCEVKTCKPLKKPKNGELMCDKDDFSFGTTCHIRCIKGYKLIGSKQRRCIGIGMWNGIKAKCREIKCRVLPALKDGNMEPSKCSKQDMPSGSICRMKCDPGYRREGPYTKQCSTSGKWSQETRTECIDESPPVFHCPSDIKVDADEDDNGAMVRWTVPVAIDNSGYLPAMKVVPAVEPPNKFPIGTNEIAYTATDPTGNSGTCQFTIKVIDTQPPRVDYCISPEPFIATHGTAKDVTWEIPEFSDNSGEEPKVVQDNGFGEYPVGFHLVTYTATDSSGNNNTCIIEIFVQPHKCAYPQDPVNGVAICAATTDTRYVCVLECMGGYDFAIEPAPSYECEVSSGIWEPEEQMPFPDCAESFVSNNVIQSGTVIFDSQDRCDDRLVQNQLETMFEEIMNLQIQDGCEQDVNCEINDIFTECLERIDEEISNAINVLPYRRRRSPPELIPTQKSEDGLKNQVEVDFNIEASIKYVNNTATSTSISQKKLLQSINNIKSILEGKAMKGEIVLGQGDQKVVSRDITFDPNHPAFMCAQGSVLHFNNSDMCVACPLGTYFNVISKTCEGCTRGTYQPEEGQLSCLVCPDKTSTKSNSSKTVGQCKAQCLPGSFSETGVEPCQTCEKGFFQPDYAQLQCLECPENKTTWRRGARQKSQCGVMCPAGYVSKTGLEPCFPCPRGYYQPNRGASSVFRCPMNVKTQSVGSTSINQCEGYENMIQNDIISEAISTKAIVINKCFEDPCKNDAECKPLQPSFVCICNPGYTGIYCETEIDECFSEPCAHNGTCINELDGYLCECKPGYTGNDCEKEINECDSTPCKNNATCTDELNSFKCVCPLGFTGQLCETNIDECESNPCKNSATCQDHIGNYTCLCPLGYIGVHCETNHNECEKFACINNSTCVDGINNYTCKCLPGYTGFHCETQINECLTFPCENGGQCYDLEGDYKCRCMPSYGGKNCEKKLSSDFDMVFPVSSTTDYVILPDLLGDLTEVTVAFWMKSTDKRNYGTAFSYATDKVDNALTITDYNGIVIYVNGAKVITDVTVNDGRWHHLAVTWTRKQGFWQIYVDGDIVDQGFDLSEGSTIHAGGTLVLGQEQDEKGDKFSASESFIGRMSKVSVFSEVLEYDEVQKLVYSCDPYIGDYVAWPDFLKGVNGRVQVANSSFCNDCKVPAEIENGKVTYDDVTLGSVVSYTCDEGYQVKGSNELRCGVYGEWDADESVCERVKCPYPGSVPYSDNHGRDLRYKGVFTYTCKRGYRMEGNGTRVCQADGTWSGEKPQCVLIFCPEPEQKSEMLIERWSPIYKLDDSIRFYCKPNFAINGTSILHCQENGTWSGIVPSCEPITCRNPPAVTHGNLVNDIGGSYAADSLARYECEKGYKMEGINTVKCFQNRTWSSTVPVCSLVICDEVKNIEHGKKIGDSYTYDSVIEYQCEHGYEIKGSSAIICLNSGEWNASIPSCNLKRCDAPTEIENGKITGLEYVYESTIQYTCNDGYALEGVEKRECLINSTWSFDPPTCNPVFCGAPNSLDNGHFTGDNFNFGGHITYSCDDGFTLEGISNSECLANKTWSIVNIFCERVNCEAPSPIDNGHVIGTGYVYEDVIEFRCDKGYDLVGSSVSTCLANATWNATEPYCKIKSCPELKDIENAKLSVTDITFGSKAVYSCLIGFEMKGRGDLSCEADGKWSHPLPVCKIIKCGKPPEIENGIMTMDNMTYGSKARYQCKKGFKMQGDESVTCSKDKNWRGDIPLCYSKQCPFPAPLPYGEITGSSYTFNSVITAKCDAGYILKGDKERTCQENGEWSGVEPNCTAVECTKPSYVISNGRMINTNFSYGATINYVCDVGYYIDGHTSRTCGADGDWDKTLPVCERIECPQPLRPLNGRYEGFEYKFKNTLKVVCRRGYEVVGEAYRTCLADGTWSGGESKCVKISCKRPLDIKNGKVIIQGTEYRQQIEYECNEGYEMIGQPRQKCGADKQWSSLPPYCAIIECGAPRLPSNMIQQKQIEYTFGSIVTYSCAAGHFYQGLLQQRCEKDKTWQWIGGIIPYCEKMDCGPPRSHANMLIKESSLTTYESIVKYTCREGYSYFGIMEQRCDENAVWSWVGSTVPICAAISCTDPPDLPGGLVTIHEGLNFGARIEYSCMPGFKMIGDGIWKCQADGQWSGSLPSCVTAGCPPPIDISYGKVKGNSFNTGESIEYECQPGYVTIGISIRKCTVNGTWSGTLPSCRYVSCPPPPDCTGGRIKKPLTTYHYGNIVEYTCDEGFELRGTSKTECLANGTWSFTSPQCIAVSCPKPQEIFFGKVIGSSFKIGDSINYECRPGYVTVGVATRKCTANGAWSGSLPSCRYVLCPILPPFQNGKTETSSYHYGSIVKYQCNTGFEREGVATRECLENGTWSYAAPRCVAVSCPPPNEVRFSQVVGSSFKIGESIKYQCKPGYVTVGVSTRECMVNGSWSGTLPSCRYVNCGTPPACPNGNVIGTSFVYGSKIKYECKEGFEIQGLQESECQANGTWSLATPRCIAVSCPPPQDVAFTKIVGSSYKIGESVKYQCKQGYVTVGVSTRECMANGSWSGTLPSCRYVRCQTPPVILHGKVVGTSYIYGSIIKYECNPGYERLGVGTRECLASGIWSHSQPRCKAILCHEPVEPSHGRVVKLGSGINFGQQIRFDCRTGYRLVGDHILTCLSNGSWSGLYGKCIRVSCPPPVKVRYATVNGSSYLFKDKIEYLCSSGYVAIGDAVRECLPTGSWSGSLPSCQRVTCPPPISFKNGQVIGTSYMAGETIIFKCDLGYELIGKRTSECSTSGDWSTAIPMCMKRKCEPLPPLLHGSTNNKLMHFGDQVRFDCDPGYRLSGTSVRQCQADGKWSGSNPYCIKVICARPVDVSHAEFIGDQRSFGASIAYKCDPGYEIQGEANRTCTAKGVWSGATPSCLRISCKPLYQFEGGRIKGSSFKFGDKISYWCNNGYQLEGRSIRECLSNGSWSFTAPRCERISCYPPVSTSEMKIIGSSHKFGDRVRYICDPGYETIGNAVSECLANGSWSFVAPTCQIVVCPRPPDLQNGDIHASSYDFNSIIYYRCNSGFKLSGVKSRKCKANKDWSGATPICIATSCDQPNPLKNGTYRGSLAIGSIINYKCNNGFILVGDNIQKCQENRTWSKISVSCERIKCNDPQTINNGKIIGDSFRFGDLIKYRCEKGYVLKGKAERECLSDRSWSGLAPVCIMMACPAPPQLQHGKVLGTSFMFGSIIEYVCDIGYELTGPKERSCMENEKWSGEDSTCVIISCPQPDNIQHGNIQGNVHTYGQTIKYICTEGYEIIGESDRTCSRYKTWTGDLPLCKRVYCAPPAPFENGVVEGNDWEYGSSIKYLCDDGFELVGIAERWCLETKVWSDKDPSCVKISCPLPPDIDNSKVIQLDATFGGNIEYECEEGFYLVGNAIRNCNNDKTWSGNVPKCQRVSCDPPERIRHGEIIGTDYLFEDVIEYKCQHGFEVAGLAKRKCLSDGGWEGTTPSCKRMVCPTPGKPQNGNFIGGTFEFGHYIHFICNDGYEIKGEAVVTCIADEHGGAWDKLFPTCIMIVCPEPEKIEKGSLKGNMVKTQYGEIIQYQCEEGYIIEGNPRRRCQRDKTWSGTLPKCKMIECEPLGAVPNGEIIGYDHGFRDVITYVCRDGFEMTGSNKQTCQEDGTWSGKPPTCVPIQCPAPPPLPNGKIDGKYHEYKDKIQFTCDEGYVLVGESSLECMADKMWNGNFPSCRKISCGKPDVVENSESRGTSYNHGDEVEYRCEKGYRLEGHSRIRCQSDGKWSTSVPRCYLITCGPPPPVAFSITNGETFHVDDFVFYKCMDGYELNGNNLLQCTSQGDWIGDLPTCEPVICGPPPVILFASTIVEKTTFGSRANYRCNEGYTIRGSLNVECKANRQWMSEIPAECVPITCGRPPLVTHGEVLIFEDTYKNFANYSCSKGYILDGKERLMCTSTGRWERPAPVCRHVACDSPRISSNAVVNGSDYSYQSVIQYSCKVGYALHGDPYRECRRDGTWSGIVPQCHRIYCQSPPDVDHGRIMGDDYGYGATVEYVCDLGYFLEGDRFTRCTEDASWSAQPPVCKEASCPEPPPVPNTISLPVSTFMPGDSIELFCGLGYERKGDMNIVCLPNNTWSTPKGFCTKKHCGKPATNDRNVVIMGKATNQYNYRDRLVYMCRPGLSPISKRILTCMENGDWDITPGCQAQCKFKCKNGGICIKQNKCKCPQGFGGRHCEKAICILPCLNGGRCVGPFQCECRPGYIGTRCERAICSKECQHGGICTRPNRCRCPYGYLPPFCETRSHIRRLWT